MKFLATILTCVFAFTLISCSGGGEKSASDAAAQELNTSNDVLPPDGGTGITDPVTPATASSGAVKHYICPEGHEEGGSDSQGTCSVCGATLQHNAAYHQQNQPQNPAATSTDPNQQIQQQLQQQLQQQQQAEPAQNAAGVWHYTCPKGCEGGAGSAGACAKCGGQLAHNAAYHQ